MRLSQFIICVVLSLLLVVNFVFSQNKIVYTPEYKFSDGIYLQFSQFLENKPLQKESLLDYNNSDMFFLRNALKKDTIVFLNDKGVLQTVKTNEMWGFAENNYVYVLSQSSFNRVLTIGTIGFFVANVTVTKTYFNDYPMGYYDPFFYGGSQTVKNEEIRRFLVDFTTGQIYPFSSDYFEQLISIDKEIFDEYTNLSNRKKRKMLFLYLRRFNEEKPLLLPKR